MSNIKGLIETEGFKFDPKNEYKAIIKYIPHTEIDSSVLSDIIDELKYNNQEYRKLDVFVASSYVMSHVYDLFEAEKIIQFYVDLDERCTLFHSDTVLKVMNEKLDKMIKSVMT